MAERRVRSKEERIAELDKKIAYHQEKIDALEEKKKALITPKMTAAQIINAAKEKGMTTEQIMKKLGID
jgi:uncharacterized coiled-coil protein SlyX